jgi:hypothetical protein
MIFWWHRRKWQKKMFHVEVACVFGPQTMQLIFEMKIICIGCEKTGWTGHLPLRSSGRNKWKIQTVTRWVFFSSMWNEISIANNNSVVAEWRTQWDNLAGAGDKCSSSRNGALYKSWHPTFWHSSKKQSTTKLDKTLNSSNTFANTLTNTKRINKCRRWWRRRRRGQKKKLIKLFC